MTFIEVAAEYRERLEESTDLATVQAIAAEINGLVYEGGQTPITLADKQKIVALIGQKTVRRPDGSVYIVKEADNQRFLQVVGSLRSLLKG